MQTLLSDPRRLPRVTASDDSIIVSAGIAGLRAGMYQNTADLVVPFDRPRHGVTGGRVVLRSFPPTVKIRIHVLQAQDGDPIPPPPTPDDLTLAVYDAYPDGRILVQTNH